MAVTRYNNQSTDKNAAALAEVLHDPKLSRAILFGSPSEGGSPSDGQDTNYPLLSVLAELEGDDGELEVHVFDGLFLFATRQNRYKELLPLLDIAQLKPNVYYGTSALSFTSHLPAEDAANEMVNHPFERFDSGTRATFFKLLSPTLSETALASH